MMTERIKREAIDALNAGYDGVFGLRNRWGQVGPYLFRDIEALEDIETEPKYCLAKTIRLLLERKPDLRLAVVVRGCDARALQELERMGRIKTDGLRFIGIACSPEQAEECNCEKPFYETLDCTGCWSCLDACKEEAIDRINVCPILLPSEFNESLSYRKAIYIPYPQAIPMKATRDSDHCLKITDRMDCKGCENVCLPKAIFDEDEEKVEELQVGSVILATGFDVFDPTPMTPYGYGVYPNVMTSMEFERVLSAGGPFQGHLIRPSDGTEPKRIAWLQCVGSRDLNQCDHPYCSSVCCMYAIKEAMIAKEHAKYELDTAIFFMDMRTHGKDFERYYNRAKEETGVRFVRSRVHSIDENPDTRDLIIRYTDENAGIKEENFDLVVLSVGMEVSERRAELARRLDVALGKDNFAKTGSFSPVETSRKGIFVCGAFQGPKDIPQSVVDAGAAAADAGHRLSTARNTLTRTETVVPEINVINDRPRIGVFVCKCGINIAGVVDVEAVAEYAATLPYVAYVTDNLYTCSQDTQESMTRTIEENNLNRIVVAACTPKTHEPLFQSTLTSAGLNKYLFEMANIRNHDSWVHKKNPEVATQKAKDLVRMSVAKVALMEPLKETALDVNQTALVVGGGLSGMSGALSLAGQGYITHLVEKNDTLGGQALSLYKTWNGEEIQHQLAQMVAAVEGADNIRVHLNTELTAVDGFVGNFTSTLSAGGREENIEHGVTVLATGAQEYKPSEYLYGKDPRVMTSLELDQRFIADDPFLKEVHTAVFIQCVGSRETERPYCSRVCCTHSVESALELKRRNPKMDVFILYRDMRTYGERELLYTEARKAGVIFVRYSPDNKPLVSLTDGELTVEFIDHILGRPVKLDADLITLAAAVVSTKNDTLAKLFRVPLNEDGFFVERHAKLGPSEFATDGVFLCGLAHYPKPIDEAVAQGKSAASRAITLLARETVYTSGNVAETNPMVCSSCGVCVSICPYSAPSLAEDGPFAGKARINSALCKGCGLCVSSCRSGAIHLKGFDNDQIFAQIFSLREAI
jgi:heterodisulfide reductase subunit A2